MSSPRRALFHSYLTNYIALGLNFVASIIIARLLTPSEIGVFSIAAAFVGLGHVIRDFGVSQYIIQEPDLTPDKIRAAFTVTLLIGWSIALVMWLIAPLSGIFYEDQGVTEVLTLLTVNFVLLPFGSITSAYLNRQMRLDKMMWIKVSAAIFQTGTAIVCAYQGLSYMSLAWGALAGTGATILVANLVRPKGLPLLPSLRGLRQVLGFGSRLGATRILGHIAEVTPELVLGKSMGMHAVGIWSRTVGTITLFNMLIMRSNSAVISPVFAEARRQQHDLKKPYLFILTVITGLAWPFYAALSVLAPDLILVLFGNQWTEAALYVQLWCIPAVLNQLTSILSNVLVSTGHINRMAKTESTLAAIRIMLGVPTALISIEALIASFMIHAVIRAALQFRNMQVVLQTDLSDLLLVTRTSLPIALAAASGALLTKYGADLIDISQPSTRLILGIATCAIFTLTAVLYLKHPLRIELTRLVNHVIKRSAPNGHQ